MRQPTTIAEVQGLRALSVLWMIGFHVLFCAGYHLSAADYAALQRSPFLFVIAQGHLAVDLFFIISGLVITRSLIQEYRERGSIQILSFYFLRWMRLIPAYAVMLLLSFPILGQAAQRQWAPLNLLFLNNFLPFDRQPAPWSWSLAVEGQFYLLAPLLALGLARYAASPSFRTSSAARALGLGLALPILAGFLLRLAVLWPPASGSLLANETLRYPHMPHLFQPEYDYSMFSYYFDTVYDKIYGRIGALWLGASLAVLPEQPALVAWLRGPSRSRRLARGLAGLATLLAVYLCGAMTLHRGADQPSSLLRLAGYRLLFAGPLAYLLLDLLARRESSPPSRLSGFLALPLLRPIARYSYSAYLLHPLLALIAWSLLAARGAQRSPGLWLWLLPCLYLLSFLSAMPLFHLVEAPARRWSRRLLSRPTPD